MAIKITNKSSALGTLFAPIQCFDGLREFSAHCKVQSISEPMTQLALDSHHFSDQSSVRKTGIYRIREIILAKPTADMRSPSMTLQMRADVRANRAKVQEVANHIEMLEKAGSPAKPKGPDNKMEEREPEVGKIENPVNNDPKVDDTPQEPGKALIKGSRLFPAPKRSI